MAGYLALFGSTFGVAEETVVPIGEEAVFHRCYGQLVRTRAPSNHPLLLDVRASRKTAVDACMALLTKAALLQQGSKYQLLDVNDAESRAILKTLFLYHESWFEEGVLPDEFYARIDHQMDDAEDSGMLTAALLAPNIPYTSVVTENRSNKVLRNRGGFQIYLKGPGIVETAAAIQQGEITGVEFYPVSSVSWWNRSGTEMTNLLSLGAATSFQSKRSFGGGIMGLQSFILNHNGYPDQRAKADGALRMPRRWSKHVYSGLLCRDIPLLRISDVSPLAAQYQVKVPNVANRIAFRPDSNCMSCHASLDSLGGVLRNIGFSRTDPSADDRQVHITLGTAMATTADETAGLHLVPTDISFYRRPPNGRLFYRSYNGNLVDEPIAGGTSIETALANLGAAMVRQDDFYMCAASRYFHFFTGIQVNLMDYKDPRNGGLITEGDLHYRNLVKGLADSLKADPNKDLKAMIRRIFSLPLYHSLGMRDEKP